MMRSVGFTKENLQNVYIYEAFVLVFAASFLGALIGSLMGWILMVSYAK